MSTKTLENHLARRPEIDACLLGSHQQSRGCTLQGGISSADRVVTVSPGYAWEIQTPEGGWGMEHMLRSRAYGLNGVLNGIDLREWNPESDEHIQQNYGASNFSRGKVANKAALQKELGLPERPEVSFRSLMPFACNRVTNTHCQKHVIDPQSHPTNENVGRVLWPASDVTCSEQSVFSMHAHHPLASAASCSVYWAA